jgi:transposase
MARFIQYDRHQQYLLPPSVDEWLPANHLARFILEVIDQLDLSRLTQGYDTRGSKAHHPAVLLALLVYGYATGVFSSRKEQVKPMLKTQGHLAPEIRPNDLKCSKNPCEFGKSGP